MNEWNIAVIGGVVGCIIALASSRKPFILKQILIIGVVGYLSLALLLLHYKMDVALLFILTGAIGYIGKKIFDTSIVRIPMITEGGEKHE